MATMRDRSAADVRRDIEREREELVHAVANLRSDIRDVTNVKPLLKKVAIGAAAIGGVIVAFKLSRKLFS
jgi:hypothetical protein